MKRLRRLAALSAALFLGVVAWFVVMVCGQTEGELRLSRELSTGRLMARVPPPKDPLDSIIFYGPANLTARFTQPKKNISGPLTQGTVYEEAVRNDVWYVRLDPLDKSWEMEVKESRPVFLRLGGKNWRVGTKTRLWRTKRVARERE